MLETTCEQDDHFPPGICVRVNGKMAPLPVRIVVFEGFFINQIFAIVMKGTCMLKMFFRIYFV